MNITQIEENIKHLTRDFYTNKVPKNQFIYDFLLAYGHRKSSVGRVKSGERNLSTVVGEVRWKRHVYYKHFEGENLRLEADKLKNDPAISRDRIRFVIVTDFNSFLAIDIKTGDSLDIKFDDIVKHFDFFLPWANMEKAVYQGENPADIKAAEKMAELFDIIKADNFNDNNKNDKEALHNLNVFLTRLLFCFFAEDTEIFSRNQFSHALESHTKADGSDVTEYLNRLFNVLNTSNADRRELPDYLDKFPFVNGGLFAKELPAPTFSTKSRKMLIECGKELDWSDINPDIFGSMIQAVVHPDQRANMGMHYTSVTNIMKVIEPLFLDDFYIELENIENNIDAKLKPNRLRKLKEKLTQISIFDPACGSGNFLIIAYKELRKFEMEVIKRLQEIELKKHLNQEDLFAESGLDSSFSELKLSQFYGIELDDFAHEVAILSLWLAEHQMNVEFKAEFGNCAATLPLKTGAMIKSGNAIRLDWETFFPSRSTTYILGNPPYLGFNNQSKEQKTDLLIAFSDYNNIGKLDYVSCWFKKAADFFKNNKGAYAFVSTSSICQGEQVSILWPILFGLNLEIFFAQTSFPWSSNARNKAAVMCVIIGLKHKRNTGHKKIYSNEIQRTVNQINAYLVDAETIYAQPFAKAISCRPLMTMGSNAIDGQNLIISKQEAEHIITLNPESKKYIKRYMGGADFLNGKERYCIWINDEDVELANKNKFISERIVNCRNYRLSAGRDAKKVADRPHRFCYRTHQDSPAIIVPQTTSSRREYLPIGITDNNTVVSAKGFVIYEADPFILGLLCSRLHNVWLATTSGRTSANNYAYSVKLTYNTFPIPTMSEKVKNLIRINALNILSVREGFPHKTLSELYEPENMPTDLKEAHKNLDALIENQYQDTIFRSDEERLETLFNLYSKMTGGQNA
jgi:hypothetical protein